MLVFPKILIIQDLTHSRVAKILFIWEIQNKIMDKIIFPYYKFMSLFYQVQFDIQMKLSFGRPISNFRRDFAFFGDDLGRLRLNE